MILLITIQSYKTVQYRCEQCNELLPVCFILISANKSLSGCIGRLLLADIFVYRNERVGDRYE